jgi:hypothetical protein
MFVSKAKSLPYSGAPEGKKIHNIHLGLDLYL